MSNLSKVFVIILAVLTVSCGSVKLPDPFHVSPNPLVNKGGKVTFTVKDTIPPKGFPKKEIIKLAPYMKYEGGTLPLKTMILKGEKAEGDGVVVNYANGGPLTYTDVFDYKPEMQVSQLWVKVYSLKGGEEVLITDVIVAEGIVITSTRVGNDETTQLANHMYEKETIISTTAKLYFAYNSSRLNTYMKLNKQGKSEMDSLRNFVGLGWEIKNVDVKAWASPEGELSLNQELSDDRGAISKKYIAKEIKKIIKSKEEVTINVAAKGADYDGFMKTLNASDIKDKNKISNVIKSQANKTEREQQIRNMTLIYKEVEDMLEVLRRAELTVNCYQPKRTDEEILRLATSSPDSLDEKEIMYSATLTEDLNTKLAIYKSAIKYYDQNWRAYNNAAAIDIMLGNADEAQQLLEKANVLAPAEGEIENNLGILAAWKKDYEVAKKHYKAAQAKGVDVTYNMGVIHMIEGNYEEAENAFASNKCSYNLALAQLENGKISEATKTLDCAPKTGEVYYLLAVIGARTNNASMLVDNLRKAIDAVPSYKNEALKDKEFINYLKTTEFLSLVK